MSKTALLGLTKALAEELGPDGIRVNAVCPGERSPRLMQRFCARSYCVSLWAAIASAGCSTGPDLCSRQKVSPGSPVFTLRCDGAGRAPLPPTSHPCPTALPQPTPQAFDQGVRFLPSFLSYSHIHPLSPTIPHTCSVATRPACRRGAHQVCLRAGGLAQA